MFIEPYLANVTIFAGNFAPRAWAFCQGQLLAISQNDALFALIGTTYGGDGITTFALPDLRGRKAVHPGTGPGLSSVILGEVGGTETVTMLGTQVPGHIHTVASMTITPQASTTANSGNSLNTYPAQITNVNAFANAAGGSVMGSSTIAANSAPNTGAQPIDILSPFLAMNYIIALEGIFPSRN